ncbi:hypothetical protein [Croceicoccus mobilis]|uniref:hypothetical protein n=1 Tax=Croceicoccus mobilis TaxID=1703339 RepID=UPI00155FF194|nr:hypothetical protein [Croceicoccus mobilis]
MDLNQLLYHHQIALMNANRWRSSGFRGAHFDMVRHYSARLRRIRHDMNVQQYR